MFSRARGRYGGDTAQGKRRPFWKQAFPSTFRSGPHSSIAALVSTRSSSSASLCRAGPATRRRRSSRGRGNRLLPKVDGTRHHVGSTCSMSLPSIERLAEFEHVLLDWLGERGL